MHLELNMTKYVYKYFDDFYYFILQVISYIIQNYQTLETFCGALYFFFYFYLPAVTEAPPQQLNHVHRKHAASDTSPPKTIKVFSHF